MPADKPHQNPTPLTPAERALFDALMGRPEPTAVALAEEAFALARCDVEDWPAADDRLRRARRHVLRTLHGERFGLEPTEDLWFAALWIARSLSESGFSPSEVVVVLDAIGLPTEAVPLYRSL
ncbi:MAG: hypothetical protein H6697_11480 [Myxococcales bacterium]|nr:hypothetical protein [Myxococcales bacterium]MCB9521442.1 hypothetical protein [Myxococcales bacterium]